MLSMLASLRRQVIEALDRNAQAADRLLDVLPAPSPLKVAYLRAQQPINGYRSTHKTDDA